MQIPGLSEKSVVSQLRCQMEFWQLAGSGRDFCLMQSISTINWAEFSLLRFGTTHYVVVMSTATFSDRHYL